MFAPGLKLNIYLTLVIIFTYLRVGYSSGSDKRADQIGGTGLGPDGDGGLYPGQGRNLKTCPGGYTGGSWGRPWGSGVCPGPKDGQIPHGDDLRTVLGPNP